MKLKALAFAGLVLMAAGAQAVTLGNTMNAEVVMRAGDNLLTKNAAFSLAMQSDGNLVIYRLSNGGAEAKWATGRAGSGAYVRMQQDGNLALYHSNNTWSWTSGTGGRPIDQRFKLVLQEDGELDIYDPSGAVIWYANRVPGTCGPAPGPYQSWPICSNPAPGVIITGTVQARCRAEADFLAGQQYAKVGSCAGAK